MVKSADVVNAIKDTLQSAYPEATIYSNDLPIGFKRPSFYVAHKARKATAENMGQMYVEARYTVACFVPVDDYDDIDRAALSELTDSVSLLFCGAALAVDDRKLTVAQTEVTGEDVQEVEILLRYYDDGQRKPDAPLMESIDWKIRTKGGM